MKRSVRTKGDGKASPTSKHADLWARYRNALSAGSIRRVRVKWVPPDEKEGSDRISPNERRSNDHADELANARAKRIGPTARQGKIYDRRAQQLSATQSIQLKILAASQATDPPKAQDQGPRGPRAARDGNRAPAFATKCHLPDLERGELRMWGPHLITSHGTEGFRCVTCARIANHKRARYALKTLPCIGRVGLAGPLQPRRPKLKWNRADEARWKRQGEGGHQAVRYNTTQHDGRWLCMRCGLHYIRFYDLCAKQCARAPGNQAATKSVADALAGGPLIRKKVPAFAKHPSGSRPRAPGASLPSDVLFFDPSVLRPPKPAIPQAQKEAAEGPGSAPQEHGPLGARQGAESRVPAGRQSFPAPLVEHEPTVALQAHKHQGEAPSEPEPKAVGLVPRSPGEGGKPE